MFGSGGGGAPGAGTASPCGGAACGVPSSGDEVAADLDAVTEDREDVGRRAGADHLLGIALAVAADRRPEGVEADQAVELRQLRLQIEEVARRDGEVDDVAVAHVVPHRPEPRGIVVGQRPQQHRIDDAENRGGGADAERDGQHGGDGKRRLAPQAAESEEHVAKD